MNKNVAIIFKSTRKFLGLQQTELAAVLGVTQGTISKIEAAQMKIEMLLWFKFTKNLRIKDPFSCEYGGVELMSLDEIQLETFKSPLLPQVNFSENVKYFISKDFRPYIDYLRENAPMLLDKILKDNAINEGIFYILNHPLPLFLVDEVLSVFKILINKDFKDIDLQFDSSFGRLEHKSKLNNFKSNIEFVQKENRWCTYKYLTENQYQVVFKNQDYSLLKSLRNFEMYYDYLILMPILFHLSVSKEHRVHLVEKREGDKLTWEIYFK